MAASSLPALHLEAVEKFRIAGRIARDARGLAISKILPGASLREVMEEVEDFIREQGAGMAFPAQTSRNACAAHYCPSPNDNTVYQEGDVVKVDIGVEVDGYVADNAETKYLGEEEHYQNLVAASRAGLDAAIATAGPGVAVRAISTEIEKAIEGFGFRPVYNLTGHGVDRWTVHCAPQIPAAPDRHDDAVLQPGMVIAIEPFATDGKGHVGDRGRAEIFMIHRPPRKMKGVDPDVWNIIDAMQGLPFARRYFPPHLRGDRLESTLQRLMRIGSVIAFPPLVDPDGSVMVAQTEHTMIIHEDGVEVITA